MTEYFHDSHIHLAPLFPQLVRLLSILTALKMPLNLGMLSRRGTRWSPKKRVTQNVSCTRVANEYFAVALNWRLQNFAEPRKLHYFSQVIREVPSTRPLRNLPDESIHFSFRRWTMRLLLITTQDTISPALCSGGVDAAEGKGLCLGNRLGSVLVGWSEVGWKRSGCCRKTSRWATCSEEDILKSEFHTPGMSVFINSFICWT